jgi:hypothetical protein
MLAACVLLATAASVRSATDLAEDVSKDERVLNSISAINWRREVG